jgi:hypothetical protein
MFDPEGSRLAVWVVDRRDAEVGRLQLVALDREHGRIDHSVAPLPGAPALRGFSIDTGRLAWVTPPGQDGQESSVQVLAWSGSNFGSVQTIPGKDLLIAH